MYVYSCPPPHSFTRTPVRLVADIIDAKLHIKTFCSSLIF